MTAALLLLFPAASFASATEHSPFPVWSAFFFVALILSIALAPLVGKEWWSKRYAAVSLLLAVPAAAVIVFYEKALLLHALLDYASFIILLGALFVIAGGIVIRTSARGTPLLNALFLLIGAVFASIIGTMGASTVLIRPPIRANRARKRKVHVFIFFIFLVSNIGGVDASRRPAAPSRLPPRRSFHLDSSVVPLLALRDGDPPLRFLSP